MATIMMMIRHLLQTMQMHTYVIISCMLTIARPAQGCIWILKFDLASAAISFIIIILNPGPAATATGVE